ncbi:MAG: methyltransferase domain-containing protein [Alphaproteobacteria bacterium]|nr:methyltransferase domain-containing protein [Alphaproteobacteria bacterium]
MTREELLRRRDAVAAAHGPWVGHNIHLGHGVYTIGAHVVGAENTAKHLLQVVGAMAARPLNQIRVLDLGCSEGLYAIEFGLHGAEVLGVEGRPDPLARARFAQETLGLDRVQFVQGDAREATAERYGRFDVILNCGLLYHLNVPDVFQVLENMAAMCDDMAIVETHYALAVTERVEHRGAEYFGISRREHEDAADPATRQKREWASLDNAYSFWLSKPSLVNAIARAGFATVTECLFPAILSFGDRETFIAHKGEARELRSVPLPGIFEDRFLAPDDLRRPLAVWEGQRHVANPDTTPKFFDPTTRDLDILRRRADESEVQIDALDQKVGGVGQRLDALEGRLGAVERRLDEAVPELVRMARETERLAAYAQSLQSSMNDWLNGFWTSLNAATSELGEARAEIQRIRDAQTRPWFMRPKRR